MKDLIFPRPKPDQKRYDDIMNKGFKIFPKRYENYKKYQDFSKNKKIKYLPIKIDIENVSRCNLKCDMCQVPFYQNNKRAEDMTFDVFKNIIDEQYGLIEVKIQGMGEPFIGKDFIKMVEYASSKYIWTRTSTNATILDKNEDYKNIVDAGIGEIQISIDGTTKDTYEKIRINANFEKVTDNCKLINNYCDEVGCDVTRMWVLLQKDNFHELKNFPSFAKELGFKRVAIIMDIHGFGNQELIDKNSNKVVSSSITQDIINSMIEEAKSLNIDLSFWDISDKFSKTNICHWPFERAYISSEGSVVPCCMIANPTALNFGTIGSFSDIWYSKEYEDFREQHIKFKIPDVCKSCYALT